MELIDLSRKITEYVMPDGKRIEKFERGSDISSHYVGIQQPMPIYHSEEELDTSETGIIKIRTVDEYITFIRENGLQRTTYVSISDKNVFIKTIDKYLPDYTDYDERVVLKLDTNGNPIPVTSCWVRVYKLNTELTKHFLYTSSGIWSIGMNSFLISAGPKRTYSSITKPTKKVNSAELYQNRFDKMLSKKKPMNREIRLVHLILNPAGPYFLDVEGAIRKIYHQSIPMSTFDKKRFLTSKLFKDTFMSELGIIIPSLTKAVRDTISPETMADFLKKVVEKAVEKETSKEAMDRLKDVMQIAYQDPVNGKRGISVPLLSDASFVDKPKQVESGKEETTEEELDELRSENGYSSSIIMNDLPANIEDSLPNANE